MTWRREVDYHGSRSYEPDGPKARLWTAIIAWLADRAARKAKTTTRKKSSVGLQVGDRRGFTLLGATSRAPQHDPVDWPFPVKTDESRHRHDRRVSP